MKNIDYSNQIQKEAILNEFKGNLFEFLVAQRLARQSGNEDLFLLELPASFRERLSSYEELVRIHDPKLLVKLPTLAEKTSKKIWEEILSRYTFTQWNVIGKMVATNDSDLWNETDIVGSYLSSDGTSKKMALSLKLSKENSYVNTKSAGAKSFLAKYFSAFGGFAYELQEKFNQEVDESFMRMGHKLYSLIDCEWRGSFNADWSDHYSELPGELNEEMRLIVHENYYRVASKLENFLKELQQKDPALFHKCLYALCGFGHSDIIQVNCFHQDYELRSISIKQFNDLFGSSDLQADIKPIKDFSSSVDILLGQVTLQVRVKPMNKFTTPAYKINCSIKVKE